MIRSSGCTDLWGGMTEKTSKYNNQQGIYNHWTCQCNKGGSCHLRGVAVAPAHGEAAIAPWRRLHFCNYLSLQIPVSVRKNLLGICLCFQVVTTWTTTFPLMATTIWTPDLAGVPTFWGYQRGAIVLLILADFLRVGCQRKKEGIELRCRINIGCHWRHHRNCREQVQRQASE